MSKEICETPQSQIGLFKNWYFILLQNRMAPFFDWTFIWKVGIWYLFMKNIFGQITTTADLAIAHLMHPIFQYNVNCCISENSLNFGLEVCNCLWIVGVTFIYPKIIMLLNRSFLMANSHHNFLRTRRNILIVIGEFCTFLVLSDTIWHFHRKVCRFLAWRYSECFDVRPSFVLFTVSWKN